MMIGTMRFWLGWLTFVAISFGIAELFLIGLAHHRGEKNIQEWTLSDAIRRWSASHRWIAPVVIGTMAMLAWHWFGQANLPN